MLFSNNKADMQYGCPFIVVARLHVATMDLVMAVHILDQIGWPLFSMERKCNGNTHSYLTTVRSGDK